MDAKGDDRRVRKTKRALRQGYAKLLLQKSAKEISVKELTDLVDLHRGTFYLHYRDIFELQEEIENGVIAEFNSIVESCPCHSDGNDIYPLALSLLGYVAENADLCAALLGRGSGLSLVEKLTDIIYERCYRDCIEAYGPEHEVEVAYFGSFVVGGCLAVVRRWLDGGMVQTPREVARIIEQIALGGVAFLSPAREIQNPRAPI